MDEAWDSEELIVSINITHLLSVSVKAKSQLLRLLRGMFPQLREELRRVPRVHEFQYLSELLAVVGEFQENGVLVCVRPDGRVRRA